MVFMADCVYCLAESIADPKAAVLTEFVLGDLELLLLCL
jgi:hypothetical protein